MATAPCWSWFKNERCLKSAVLILSRCALSLHITYYLVSCTWTQQLSNRGYRKMKDMHPLFNHCATRKMLTTDVNGRAPPSYPDKCKLFIVSHQTLVICIFLSFNQCHNNSAFPSANCFGSSSLPSIFNLQNIRVTLRLAAVHMWGMMHHQISVSIRAKRIIYKMFAYTRF